MSWLTKSRHICKKPSATNEREDGIWQCDDCCKYWLARWDCWVLISERRALRRLHKTPVRGSLSDAQIPRHPVTNQFLLPDRDTEREDIIERLKAELRAKDVLIAEALSIARGPYPFAVYEHGKVLVSTDQL